MSCWKIRVLQEAHEALTDCAASFGTKGGIKLKMPWDATRIASYRR